MDLVTDCLEGRSLKIRWCKQSSNGIRFIEPMYAGLVEKVPEGEGWLYEVKFDGYRCLAGNDSSGVALWSRRGNRAIIKQKLKGPSCYTRAFQSSNLVKISNVVKTTLESDMNIASGFGPLTFLL